MKIPESDSVRFHSKFTQGAVEDCWDWEGGLLLTGYGQFGMAGKTWRAHRLAYLLTNGEIPEGQVVRHTCDNRRCVNPAHLELGTQQQNLIDMALRGRKHDGGLAADDVRDCRRRADAGETMQSIADDYGVKHVTVSAAIRGRTWAHILDPAPVPPNYRRARKETQPR